MRPFSQACENNRQPILDVLRAVFADSGCILEIGSGTGQHAAYFAPALSPTIWQPSDLVRNHAGIDAWIDAHPIDNLRRPLDLDVDRQPWPVAADIDGIFTANTCHIMAWSSVENMFAGAAHLLGAGAALVIYGPFNYGGEFTSPSNARFDAMLRRQASHQGIRDFEAIERLAAGQGFELGEDYPMPANNRLLVWRKKAR
ncbi:MAG TPA: methylase [Porticoccaceae bacterium]|nr:methylase [Porticoccaceae bacterium]